MGPKSARGSNWIPAQPFECLSRWKSTAFRQDSTTGKYHLGVICLELGSQFLKLTDVRRTAVEAMQKLADQFGKTIHLGILDGDQIVYLEKVSGSHAIGFMSSRVGGRAPAHATAISKVLLANIAEREVLSLFPLRRLSRCMDATLSVWNEFTKELARVRESGYAIDNQEFEVGVKCVAAPIFSHKGVMAALSTSGPLRRMEEHIRKAHLIDTLQGAVANISTEMGWGRGVDQVGKSKRADVQKRNGKEARLHTKRLNMTTIRRQKRLSGTQRPKR